MEISKIKVAKLVACITVALLIICMFVGVITMIKGANQQDIYKCVEGGFLWVFSALALKN